jgi:hypothetical protein
MLKPDGIIIILSYPDTIVRPAYWEFSSKIWPLFGVGGKHAVQAGHAAFLLIKKGSSEIEYFDFGRYITSFGKGRVRSKESDPELYIPLNAKFEKEKLSNLKEILLWIERHPEKTHGEGRLIATINFEISFSKAKKSIQLLINKKEIPYGAFIKEGTNCARFVTDTIIGSSTNKKIISHLKKSNLFTPSPIGNVIKGTSTDKIYEVHHQKITFYKNRSIIKEYKDSFLNKFEGEPNLIGTELPNKEIFELENGTWLGGIGSGAWFKIEEKLEGKCFNITRHTSSGIKDFEGLFTITDTDFNHLKAYQFIYPTSCKEVFIQQKNKIFCFQKKG